MSEVFAVRESTVSPKDAKREKVLEDMGWFIFRIPNEIANNYPTEAAREILGELES